jgi:hypothetical protein
VRAHGPEFRRDYRIDAMRGVVRELNPDAHGRHVFLWWAWRPTGKTLSGSLPTRDLAEQALVTAMLSLRPRRP